MCCWFLTSAPCSPPVSMEDSSEQSHWVSPALLSSDALAGFSSEPGLLPPVEEGESFFSGQDSDYSGLSSFFSNPSHSRAASTYRHSSGQCPTHCHPTNSPPTPTLLFMTLSIFSKFDRCSARRASSATSSSWTCLPPTPWAHPTTPPPPPGAAALSPRPHCTHTPRLPSTLLDSPPPSSPPEMDTALRAERTGRAPGFRRPWRSSAWARWGGQVPAAASWTWLLPMGVYTHRHPTPTHTCWAPTARTWLGHRSTVQLLCTPAPGSTPRSPPNSATRWGYPLQVRTHWDMTSHHKVLDRSVTSWPENVSKINLF